jgi:hypothetical protein
MSSKDPRKSAARKMEAFFDKLTEKEKTVVATLLRTALREAARSRFLVHRVERESEIVIETLSADNAPGLINAIGLYAPAGEWAGAPAGEWAGAPAGEWAGAPAGEWAGAPAGEWAGAPASDPKSATPGKRQGGAKRKKASPR